MSARRSICAVAAAALVLAAPAAAFVPPDPLAPQQWYLGQDHAFDTWPEPPAATLFTPVKVAVVDSGVDYTHPDLAGRIVAGRSFVGGDWRTDANGHGTFVAGLIAANSDQVGIAGIAFPAAKLVIAKVVEPNGLIPPAVEAAAIRWAVNQGARVINLSLGAVRDPKSAAVDGFSQQEADAVAYAYQKGAVVVAAVGNGDESPRTPWPFASYPAALPHVLGVSALTKTGAVPPFSNRDRLYNDLAAPGQDILSTFPRSLSSVAGCTDVGYSDCGPDDYRHARGTSFAAPQVAAAAAMLISLAPALRPDQVGWLLERGADDMNAANGCTECVPGRDALSGWGRLDLARSIALMQGPVPPPDRLEANDEAGGHAHTLYGDATNLTATLDYWDDQVDVYRVRLQKGQQLAVRLRSSPGSNVDLVLWRPGTTRVDDLASQRYRLVEALRPGTTQRLRYRAGATGWYFLEAKIAAPGAAVYALELAKTKAKSAAPTKRP